MIKCNVCANHKQRGKKHVCRKCDTKIIYGVMQEPFIGCCQYFTMTAKEKQRRAYCKKITSLPIDDSGRGGKKKHYEWETVTKPYERNRK